MKFKIDLNFIENELISIINSDNRDDFTIIDDYV